MTATLLTPPRTASVTLEVPEPTPPHPNAVVTYSVEAGDDGREERPFLRQALEDLANVGRNRGTLTAWTTTMRCQWYGDSWSAWRKI